MLRFLDRANAITLAGLAAGLAAALLAAEGRLSFALVALVAAGLCDIFDGLVARRLTRSDEEKRFGQRLDSAVDACSFGIAPVLVLHAAGARHPAEVAVLGLYAACAVWRLAYFDTMGLEGGTHYTGLPTTFAALVIPVACTAGYAGVSALRIAADASAAALALLMVSPLRVKKPKGAWYGFFLLVAVGISALYLVRPLP